ncbi:MAG: hypothetical protein LIP12_05850 [Clostridiales bacterium]|nr:hypothetical protein [Clostridiales bacterium]
MMTVAEIAELVRLTADFEGKTIEEAWAENMSENVKAGVNFDEIRKFLEEGRSE